MSEDTKFVHRHHSLDSVKAQLRYGKLDDAIRKAWGGDVKALVENLRSESHLEISATQQEALADLIETRLRRNGFTTPSPVREIERLIVSYAQRELKIWRDNHPGKDGKPSKRAPNGEVDKTIWLVIEMFHHYGYFDDIPSVRIDTDKAFAKGGELYQNPDYAHFADEIAKGARAGVFKDGINQISFDRIKRDMHYSGKPKP